MPQINPIWADKEDVRVAYACHGDLSDLTES